MYALLTTEQTQLEGFRRDRKALLTREVGKERRFCGVA